MPVEIIKDTETVNKVIEVFPDVQDAATDANGIPVIIVPAEKLLSVMLFLRDERKYDFFNCLTAAEDDNFYISIYSLYTILDNSNRRITVKVNSPKDNPLIPSIVNIYPAADWHEREAFDLMGIIYEGHPNLSRILTTDDWVGHTLRRDYKIVEPESYTSILKQVVDPHVIEGLERTNPYGKLKNSPTEGIAPSSTERKETE